MKRFLTVAISLLMAFTFIAPARALDIPTSNNVHTLQAGEFASVDGWYSGEITVGWHGNANNSAELTWAGNGGDVVVAPYAVDSNQQREGALDVRIQQTTQEQSVVFTITKVNGKTMTATVVVPPLYSGPISYEALRTSSNPGYYYSGAIIDLGATVSADAIDKDTFSAKARITEADGSVQGGFGNFGWDPEKESYALGDGWAQWNILDAYVVDADGNPAEQGQYVKLEIEWNTRTEPNGTSSANRYDVPATRAAWYTVNGLIAFASIELDITQQEAIAGLHENDYVQGDTRHDPIFDQFEIADAPGGGTYSLYTPANASEENLRPLFVWFHGTGERFHGTNPGANLIGNRALAFADTEFQDTLDGAYVLAPQSTTTGWGAHRLADMEALIATIIADNNVDPDRVYVGGLSMGTAMTTPLITSQTENQLDFAAAILTSGGNLNAEQAAIVAAKGFPVYLVGNTSDWAAASQPATLANLLAAGVDAQMARYPAGPVYDGEHYFGAHDSWNYVYNNLVVDEEGETIFEWIAKQSR
ncbi:PHB depolymerase family esterase [Tessaracoccus sp. MC1756]|uniref:carboxylesterase family protein n=1 Tax=Tessaracoccus sp. MC1756 TaxID=2760311 RepID=UPI001600B7BA|nr:PHB depolymerase family esterase [Tessaracoccus sp. MC1756]MBB1509319.1 hypothetical protein [Tessaracoccus sp. MC1756]